MIKIYGFQRGSEVDRDGFSNEVGVRDAGVGPSSYYKNNIFSKNQKFFFRHLRHPVTACHLIHCDENAPDLTMTW